MFYTQSALRVLTVNTAPGRCTEILASLKDDEKTFIYVLLRGFCVLLRPFRVFCVIIENHMRFNWESGIPVCTGFDRF